MEGWVKMLSTMVGRQRKIKKKHWLKRPSAVPKKRNLNQNINYSISHIWNSFFENSISGIQSSYICPDVSVGIIWDFFFFNFRISSRTSKNQQKLAKRITQITIVSLKKTLLILNLLDIENNMIPKYSQKPFWLYKCSSKHVSL